MRSFFWPIAWIAIASSCVGTADKPVDEPSAADEDSDGYALPEDCDDSDPRIHPDADEYCDGVDEDCDGQIDNDALDGTVWLVDADGDGYGDDATATGYCDDPVGSVLLGGDCDDGDTAFHPGAGGESCEDPSDYDCDGSTEFVDEDADGYGACVDCDDLDAARHPDAEEACDFIDDNCDGIVDETCDEVCDDGLDNNGDFLFDCDDPMCWGECPEAECLDGLDNDGDGLTDCEDGDCVDSGLCIESCDDGLDNDSDGLIDCQDDECWGLDCHPEGVATTVHGGTFDLHKKGAFYSYQGCGYGGKFSYGSFRGAGADIWGTARVVTESSGTATCTWSVSSMNLDGYQYFGSYGGHVYSSVSLGSFNRNGFEINSGCSLAGSSFLPTDLMVEGPSLLARPDETRWYLGEILDSSIKSKIESSFGKCHGGGSYVYRYGMLDSSFSIELGSGESWTAEP